jgi:hypothetical protein
MPVNKVFYVKVTKTEVFNVRVEAENANAASILAKQQIEAANTDGCNCPYPYQRFDAETLEQRWNTIVTLEGQSCAASEHIKGNLNGVVITIEDNEIFRSLNLGDTIDYLRLVGDIKSEYLIVTAKHNQNVLVCRYADPG